MAAKRRVAEPKGLAALLNLRSIAKSCSKIERGSIPPQFFILEVRGTFGV